MIDRFLGIRLDDQGRAPPIDFRGAYREGLPRRLSGRMVGQPLIEMRAGPTEYERAVIVTRERVHRVRASERASGCVLKRSRAFHSASTRISN